jgi:hypothetical protein
MTVVEIMAVFQVYDADNAALPADPAVLLVRFTWFPTAEAETTALPLMAEASRVAIVLPVSPAPKETV